MEIEFLDPADGPDLPPAPVETIGPDTPERRRLNWDVARPAGAALVMYAGTAALALAAPFQTLFAEGGLGGQVDGTAVDGWGRYHGSFGAGVPSGIHDTRYGIPLACGAGVCAALVVLLGAAVLRGRAARAARFCAVGGLAAAALLAGVAAAMWLHLDALYDTIRASEQQTDATPEQLARIQLGVGAASWLASAAVVAALLGAYASIRLREPTNVTPPA